MRLFACVFNGNFKKLANPSLIRQCRDIFCLKHTNIVSAIACLQELVLHLICLLYTTTDALTDVCTKCVFYVPDIMQAMYTWVDICNP